MARTRKPYSGSDLRMRPTIEEVARAADVSPTTVSHVLNGKGRVDAGTRERVLSVARTLGYRPSLAARSLASGRTLTLGLSLPQVPWQPLTDLITTEWYARMIACTAHRATERRYAIAVLPDFRDVDDCRHHAVDGILVLDPSLGDPRLDLLEQAGIAHVTLGRDSAHPHVPCVAPDMGGGLRALLSHIGERGARRILLLAAPARWSFYLEEMEAARAWADAVNVCVTRVEVGSDARDREALMGAVSQAAGAALGAPNPPDAIVGLLGDFGPNILLAAIACGLAIPRDVRVAQDVDTSSTQVVTPAITALDPLPYVQARTAIDLLIDVLEGTCAETTVTTPVTLRVRAST
jgi:DNA-binding LacI/PurR family transcriptional regulator